MKQFPRSQFRTVVWVVAVTSMAATLLVPSVVAAPKAAARSGRDARQGGGLPEAVTTAASGPVMMTLSVDRTTQDEVRRAAAEIDALVQSHWLKHGVTAAKPLTDSQFLRRIYLELGGRIPDFDEAQQFLTARGETRRADLVDDLLESPDYVSHFYNYWADILRLSERPQRQLFFEPYLHYIKESIRTNRPYDRWVHEMLTADGQVWENPAVGFQLRDAGMPLPYVDNTVRVLLGTQIGCAQCHDHPFDDWTQRQFYELAAHTAGTKPRVRPKQGERSQTAAREAKLIGEARRSLDRPAQFIQFIRANTTVVSHADVPLKLPHDYQYADAKPLDIVSPKLLWGEVPVAAEAADRRGQFAAWVVARENRQFARTIANRLWKKVMGVGLVEPVDDFQSGNPPSNPELLEHLTDELLRLDFDLREFVRLLVSTDVYQRRAVVYDPTLGEPFRYPAPALRRMTAEQIWDSILTLVARNPWSVQRPTAEEIAAAASLDFETATLDSAQRTFEEFSARYAPPRRLRAMLQVCGYRGQLLVRASEMPTPLPLGHFLRQFGQSDRESIEGGRTGATVPQILAMFNGPITHSMLQRGSVIYDNVVDRPPQQAVDVVFLSVLSHRPSAVDRRVALEELGSAESSAAGLGNLIWALLNTREFIFIQ